jgi:hypothetical protein
MNWATPRRRPPCRALLWVLAASPPVAQSLANAHMLLSRLSVQLTTLRVRLVRPKICCVVDTHSCLWIDSIPAQHDGNLPHTSARPCYSTALARHLRSRDAHCSSALRCRWLASHSGLAPLHELNTGSECAIGAHSFKPGRILSSRACAKRAVLCSSLSGLSRHVSCVLASVCGSELKHSHACFARHQLAIDRASQWQLLIKLGHAVCS